MTQQQIAVLELALVTDLGAILFIAGILIKVFADRKNRRCTSETVGTEMEVHYDPNDPGNSYVGVPVNNAVLCRVFLIAGAGIAALGAVLYFLILNG